jgi:hypothetical protein
MGTQAWLGDESQDDPTAQCRNQPHTMPTSPSSGPDTPGDIGASLIGNEVRLTNPTIYGPPSLLMVTLAAVSVPAISAVGGPDGQNDPWHCRQPPPTANTPDGPDRPAHYFDDTFSSGLTGKAHVLVRQAPCVAHPHRARSLSGHQRPWHCSRLMMASQLTVSGLAHSGRFSTVVLLTFGAVDVGVSLSHLCGRD